MRIKLLHKTLLVIGLALVICGFSMQASADTFAFEQHSGFSVQPGDLLSTQVASPQNDIKWYQNLTTPVPAPAGDFNTIAWGKHVDQGGLVAQDPFGIYGNMGNSSSNLSALKVVGQEGDVSTGAVSTDWGNWVTITTLYHQNNVLRASYPSLMSAIINSELKFLVDGTDSNSIPISFTETKNVLPCEGAAYGSTVCPDKFGFSVAGFAPINFSDGGKTYEVAFQLANFFNSQQNATGLPNMVIWTEEGQTSTLDVQMQIREVVTGVPEPATLILLGLGLLGLGFTKRRDK